MRHGSVRAASGDGDLKGIIRCHQRARTHVKGSGILARHVVYTVDRLTREFIEQALFNHHPRPTFAFFGGLKNEVNGALELTGFGEVFCRTQQH